MLPAPYDMTATTFLGSSDRTSKLVRAMAVDDILNSPDSLVIRVFTIANQRALDIEAKDKSQDDNKEITNVLDALLRAESGRIVRRKPSSLDYLPPSLPIPSTLRYQAASGSDYGHTANPLPSETYFACSTSTRDK